MKLKKIKYTDLNSKQKEVFNFQKVAGKLSDYGYNCIKLADDWQGADFLAYHKDGSGTLKVQLKARLALSKKYVGKSLYMAFPMYQEWYLIEHDALVRLVERCFRHQLLLPRPYLVLTKPLRLDIQCQRGASVKIGWKYLDD